MPVISKATPGDRAYTYWAKAVGSARSGNLAEAKKNLAEIDAKSGGYGAIEGVRHLLDSRDVPDRLPRTRIPSILSPFIRIIGLDAAIHCRDDNCVAGMDFIGIDHFELSGSPVQRNARLRWPFRCLGPVSSGEEGISASVPALEPG